MVYNLDLGEISARSQSQNGTERNPFQRQRIACPTEIPDFLVNLQLKFRKSKNWENLKVKNSSEQFLWRSFSVAQVEGYNTCRGFSSLLVSRITSPCPKLVGALNMVELSKGHARFSSARLEINKSNIIQAWSHLFILKVKDYFIKN